MTCQRLVQSMYYEAFSGGKLGGSRHHIEDGGKGLLPSSVRLGR